MPPTLTAAQIVITVLAFLVGALNVAIQTGKILNQWPVPAKVGPYLVVGGSFLGGVYGYFQSQSPLVLSAAVIFYACFAGLSTLLVGASPAVASHIFGAAVNVKRPAPAPADVASAQNAAKPPSAPGGVAAILLLALGLPRILGAFLAASILVVALAIPVNGCSLFASGSKFPTDAENAAACVVGDIEQGQTNVGTIVTDCSSFAPALIIDIIGALTNSPQFAAAHPTAMAPLKASLATARAK